jgi:hypothetical protein
MQILSLERIPATRLLNAMVAEGFIVVDEEHPVRWTLTNKAAKLAHATAAPPMARAVAERTLADAISRAKALNDAGCELAYGVAQLLVFGSYLTDAPFLNDLDLAVEWRPRYADRDEQDAYERARIADARDAGRQFSNYGAELFFPKREAHLFLKARVSRISLHDLREERDFIAGIPHSVVYVAPAAEGHMMTSLP